MEENQTKFVVGLGNPGRRYERTRHNVGFRVLQELVTRYGFSSPRNAFNGLVFDGRIASQRTILLAPQTFMNLSGQAVLAMTSFYKASLQDVLVVLDDMALDVGRMRFRPDGSSGGQKGLADIIVRLGTDAVPRLRIGIGAPPPPMTGSDFVLSSFNKGEEAVIQETIQQAAFAVEDWIVRGMTFVMERYNRKGPEAQDNQG